MLHHPGQLKLSCQDQTLYQHWVTECDCEMAERERGSVCGLGRGDPLSPLPPVHLFFVHYVFIPVSQGVHEALALAGRLHWVTCGQICNTGVIT